MIGQELMTKYEMACTTIPVRMNEELETRNKEGWEPINLAIGGGLTCVLFRKTIAQ